MSKQTNTLSPSPSFQSPKISDSDFTEKSADSDVRKALVCPPATSEAGARWPELA
jgi:hypothetical protein